jgi:hypothetical protein
LVGKPEVKIPLQRSWHREKGNIRMDLGEIGWKFLYWMHLAQDRDQWQALVNTVVNFRVP